MTTDPECVLVCVAASEPTVFTDNLVGHCTFCAAAVQHRPHVPPGARLCCVRCFEARATSTDDIWVTRKTLAEIIAWRQRN